jgi:hypothetical protein
MATKLSLLENDLSFLFYISIEHDVLQLLRKCNKIIYSAKGSHEVQ